MKDRKPEHFGPFREHLHEILFEADKKAGRVFHISLYAAILLSVIVVMLETVPYLRNHYGRELLTIEWMLTIFFSVEYGLRLYCVHRPVKYATSFFGIVDLLAILPTYLSVIFVGSQSLLVIRALRLLRIFRVLKLGQYTRNGRVLLSALRRSVPKLVMFMMFVLVMVIIFGSIMYLIEGHSNSQFDSIPRSVYWAIVTITTVGYGDISPHTVFGQMFASFMMLIGYAVIAVPTGIVSVELFRTPNNTQSCRYCARDNHADDAIYCMRCGERLNPEGE